MRIRRVAAVILAVAVAVVAVVGVRLATRVRVARERTIRAGVAAVTAPAGHQALYAVAPDGTAAITITAPLETTRAEVTTTAGVFALDPLDLTNVRGDVRFDVTTVVTHSFDSPTQNAAQTGHARNWLEVGPDVTPVRREAVRWARFAIRRVVSTSAHDLASGEALPADGGGVQRSVHFVLDGELTVHGITVPRTAAVDAVFIWAPGAPAGANPARIEVHSSAPVPVSLATQDVKPRDPAGVFLDGALAVVGQKLADTAMVSFHFSAIPTTDAHP